MEISNFSKHTDKIQSPKEVPTDAVTPTVSRCSVKRRFLLTLPPVAGKQGEPPVLRSSLD